MNTSARNGRCSSSSRTLRLPEVTSSSVLSADRAEIVRPDAVRRTILQMLYRAGASHLGSSMSMVEILIAVYGACNLEAIRNRARNRDRVIVSKGHSAAAVYATMHHYGLLDA